ncbi:hypothetical protein Cgig2_026494 [Carnegiea gigantea]|uniref:Uncharacterized protein n=1 Tax=Carnegiea gigantea TaxID=171969 RepID=A0A9Q1KFZ4_9CARY|nr:hypothetical protein Cgig2_026494 [Carnegiea gigantea]
MDMIQKFHMNKGEGETSYAKNSTVQAKAAIEDYLTKFGYFPETMAIAELGCSSGPNALMAVSEILDAVAERCSEFDRRKSPKFMVPKGLDGKEHGEMVNKGKIYLSKTSPKSVISAYMLQFRKDFMSFLKCRSQEVIPGGRMVLAFIGRSSTDPICEIACAFWDLIASTLMTMVSEGILDEERVDSFNVPYYAPCLEELKQMIGEEASFSLDRFETFEVEWDGGEKMESLEETRGERIAKMHRAVLEPMFDHHFGRAVVYELFIRYARIIDHFLSKQALKSIYLASKKAVAMAVVSNLKLFSGCDLVTAGTVEMDMHQVFHMNKGEGEASYAKNSTVQNKILSITKPFLEAAIEDYLTTFRYFPETMAIAELGCSSGPNTLTAVSEILDKVAEKCMEFGHRKSPKFMVFLNDLPGNDFNEVPAGLDGKELGAMVNKGKIYLSKTSPKSVISAYMLQFRNDFMSFLKCRSKEVISGGRMGILDEEKVDSFNIPYYAPCLEELKQMIGEEASFSLNRFEVFEVEWDGGERMESLEETRGERIAKMHTAVIESVLDHHFGREVVDQLFIRYARIVDDLLSKQALKLINLVISLTRN